MKIDSESAESAAWTVPLSALDGEQCGLACDVCPLRRWKSAALSAVVCTEVLDQHRQIFAALRPGARNQ